MDKKIENKFLPVLWNYGYGRTIGRAMLQNGSLTMEITDPDVISAIKGNDFLRGISINPVIFMGKPINKIQDLSPRAVTIDECLSAEIEQGKQ